MKTLIVEDDFSTRILLQAIIERYGETHMAVNGREAVAAFHLALDGGRPYDLVCLDIMMPEMDGQEVLCAIRQEEKNRGIAPQDGVKIVMATALNDAATIMKSFKEQCDGYLIKPFDPPVVIAKIKELGLLS